MGAQLGAPAAMGGGSAFEQRFQRRRNNTLLYAAEKGPGRGIRGRSFADVREPSVTHGGEVQLAPGGRCRHTELGDGEVGTGSPGRRVLPAQDPCLSGGPGPPPGHVLTPRSHPPEARGRQARAHRARAHRHALWSWDTRGDSRAPPLTSSAAGCREPTPCAPGLLWGRRGARLGLAAASLPPALGPVLGPALSPVLPTQHKKHRPVTVAAPGRPAPCALSVPKAPPEFHSVIIAVYKLRF